ncbi:MAG: aldehyde dehydrogenase family protein [Synechococcales bacterium]|nr:aldehyde dehydrogenase family protein [Synechococcales bacterium]
MTLPVLNASTSSIAITQPDFATLDAQITQLSDRKADWLTVSIADRLIYLRECLTGVQAVAAAWSQASCLAKGIDPDTALAGEEWLAGAVATAMGLRSLMTTLEAKGQRSLQVRARELQANSPVNSRTNSQAIVQVFPENWMESLLFLGHRGEVWLEPGQPASAGLVYQQKPDHGQLCLVLGAGNLSCIPILDAIHKLFVEDQVVLLKMNPVNDYVGRYIQQALQPLVQAGFLQVVYGDARVGAYLCQHSQVDTIHITGSHHTHDCIVWGENPIEQKAIGQPLLPKPITSELGGVTPIFVVPGQWSKAALQFQARQVAASVAHNASFDCVAGKVLVLAEGWAQRQEFLELVQQTLAQIPPRKAYYPGAWERYETICDRYPQAQPLTPSHLLIADTADSPAADRPIPWTFIPQVSAQAGEWILTQEAFCGVLAEVTLPAQDVETYLQQAVAFGNETIWGNLGCMILVDPRSQRCYATALENAIAQLQYGIIGVNIWAGTAFLFPGIAWGAFAGNPLEAVQSGRGFVHNTYLLEHPQKSVFYAPFQIFPTPTWFADHRNLKQVAQRYLDWLVHPNLWGVIKVAIAAVQG